MKSMRFILITIIILILNKAIDLLLIRTNKKKEKTESNLLDVEANPTKPIKLVLAILANPEPINGGENNAKKQGIINSTNVNWLNNTAHADFIQQEIKKNLNTTDENLKKNLKIETEFVPLYHWQTDSQIEEILNNVNGILFTGGDRHINFNFAWEKFMLKVSQKILEKQEKGRSIPWFGICQGFELFHGIIVNTTKVFGDYDAWIDMIPTEIVDQDKLIDKKRSIFNFLTEDEKTFLEKNNSLTHYHKLGISPDQYKKKEFQKLNKIFQILSFGYDKKGKKFVDTVESLSPYNMYGVQFHPEKDPIAIEENSQIEKEFFLQKYRIIMKKLAINFFIKAVEDVLFIKSNTNIDDKEQNKFIDKIKMNRSKLIYHLHGKQSYPIYLFSE